MGSLNLDLAILLQASAENHWLAAVSQDLHHVRFIACSSRCDVAEEQQLSGRLSRNLASVLRNGEALVAATDNQGNLWLWGWQ